MAPEIDNNIFDDKVLNERSRLLILMKLAGSPQKNMSFTDLKEFLNFSSGNLSTHLKILEAGEYIAIEKTFKNNKPLTTLTINEKGIKALDAYFSTMEKLIDSYKNRN